MVSKILDFLVLFYLSSLFLGPSFLISLIQPYWIVCGSPSLYLLFCTYSSLFLECSFPWYIFGNLSFFFKLRYPLYQTQLYRHSEFCAPTESFARLYISTYHTLLWLNLLILLPHKSESSLKMELLSHLPLYFYHLKWSLVYGRSSVDT